MTTLICQPIKQPKPCVKCGGVERIKNGKCRQCNLAINKEWQQKNAKKVNSKSRTWKKTNPEKGKESGKKWAKENPFSNAMVKKSIMRLKIAVRIGFSNSDIPPELVELKRLQMKLHNAIKSMVQ